ncbi:DUF2750 domain-containing protein [Bacillus subtilis]|uniref:DUF2750 domain-containing protein n=1 Tax=Bacillus subtilis TaxID=1423 RepID=UPI001F36EFFC|nr:DUF2750 domain-containing protein [Bacillus subtilis]
MNEKELEMTLKLDPDQRYRYFIKKVVDYEEVWSLSNDKGWVTSKTIMEQYNFIFGRLKGMQNNVQLRNGRVHIQSQ